MDSNLAFTDIERPWDVGKDMGRTLMRASQSLFMACSLPVM